MASLTTAQIQAKIDALNTTYDALAAESAQSRSAAGRSESLRELAQVRIEIEQWEKRLDRSTRAGATFTQGRPVR